MMYYETIIWMKYPTYKPEHNGWYLVTYHSGTVTMLKWTNEPEVDQWDRVASYSQMPRGYIGE